MSRGYNVERHTLKNNVLAQQQQQHKQFASGFLSFDNFKWIFVQPTNYIELEELNHL